MVQSIQNAMPNGQCPKCGMFLLNGANNTKTCVNCDIKPEPSGVVNTTEDPGHEAMAKILSQAVVLSPEERAEEERKERSRAVPIKVAPIPSKVGDMLSIESALKIVQEQLSAIPIRDLKQAKVLLKLRKDVEVLANKIENFTKGEN